MFRKAVPLVIATLLAVPAFANTDAPASPAQSIHLAAAGRNDTTSGQQTTKHKKHHKKHHKSQQKPASSG